MDEPDSATTGLTYVRVAVEGAPVHLDGGVLTYGMRTDGAPIPAIGQLIRVGLRQRLVLGFVVGFTDVAPEFSVRPIGEAIDPAWVLNPQQFEIATWMARETASSVFACASLYLPPGRKWRAVDVYTLNPGFDATSRTFTDAQQQVIDELQIDEELTRDALRQRTGRKLTAVLADLVKMGAITRWQRPQSVVPRPRIVRVVRVLDADVVLGATAARQRAVLEAVERLGHLSEDGLVPLVDLQDEVEVPSGVLKALVEKGAIEVQELPARDAPEPRASRVPALSEAQALVWQRVESALGRADSTPHLLFGVTGSGKTEIYLRAVAWCLRHGKTALVLVPEIALATQVVRRFIDRFPERVDVLHSGMTDAQRYDLWSRVAAGEVDVVVGPRSSLFAPIANLGLIVMDEEHDASFKQDIEPRYHARAVAERLAALTGAVMLMGSATPAVESMYRARAGEIHLLSLPHRVSPALADGAALALPEVRVVDLRAELRAGNNSLLSRELQAQVERSLAAEEQSIVLLNRRGMSTVVLCRDHGHRIVCPNCDIPLVYHADMRVMICHRCDYRMAPPHQCPECESRLDYLGAGTQRVEEAVKQRFPDARVLRWDADAVRQHGYQRLLDRAERYATDIIVGTQMVSKGFDLPRVTTIGVVQADSMLYLPDFRSSERTFQLLTQVAGRAGRCGPGSVVVFQTYTPAAYAVQAASKHDYDRFYAQEIGFRERHRYPPYHRLARLVYRADEERAAAIEAEMLARAFAQHAFAKGIEMEILGPTPAFVARIRNQYQWQLVVRTQQMAEFVDGMPRRPGWMIDIDPESML